MIGILELFFGKAGILAFLLRKLPDLFADNGLVKSIVNGIIICPYDVRFVAGADPFHRFAATVCDLAAVDRIVQHCLDEVGGEGGQHVVLSQLFGVAVAVQILGDGADPVARMHIPVIDDPDDLGFILGNQDQAVFQPIAVRCKAAIPLALAGLLLSADHGLRADIFTLDFCHSGQNGDHQLAAFLGGINAILHADQVDAIVLHELKGVQHVRCVSAETGELEDENIINAVLLCLNVLKHPPEFHASLNVLSGEALVRVFADDGHFLIRRISAELFSLRVQRVAVNLHAGGYTGVDVAISPLPHHLHQDSPPSGKNGPSLHGSRSIPVN